MEAVQIKMAFAKVKFHAMILWRGFCRTIYGTAVAGLIAMAIYGFISVTTKTGWVAVCVFISSCAFLMAALVHMYSMGSGKKGGRK